MNRLGKHGYSHTLRRIKGYGEMLFTDTARKKILKPRRKKSVARKQRA